MNLSEPFIKRPIATSLFMAAIALFGTVAYRALPVSDLPNVDFPTLLVTASLPGASPDTMASAVATPLENQFSTIAGLESMTSVNSLGSTQVTLEFALNRSLDGAAVDVQAAITQAADELGDEAELDEVLGHDLGEDVALFLVELGVQLGAEAQPLLADARLDDRVEAGEGTAHD